MPVTCTSVADKNKSVHLFMTQDHIVMMLNIELGSQFEMCSIT